MIRLATEEDYPIMLAMAEQFWKQTVYEEEFEYFQAKSSMSLSLGQGLILVVENEGEVVGLIAAIMAPLMANASATFAVETMFYVLPQYRGSKVGIQLINSMEDLLKEKGVKYCNMVSMESSIPDVIEKVYTSKGYTKCETTYFKVL